MWVSIYFQTVWARNDGKRQRPSCLIGFHFHCFFSIWRFQLGHLETFGASSKDSLPKAFAYRKLMPDISCQEEPQIQIKCRKSVNFLPWRCQFFPGGAFLWSFYVSWLICHLCQANADTPSAELVKLEENSNSHSPHIQPHNKTYVFFAVHVPVDFLAGSDSNWNRPISSKESQLKYRVDTLAFGCAFCYGIVIPCCLLYLYGKQHMVLEVNRTRTVARWHWRWGCSFDFFQQKSVPYDFSPVPRLMLSTRAIWDCASMTFSAPRAKRFQGRTGLSHTLWLQQPRHTSPCSIVDGCLGRASHVLESKLRSNPQKQFCYSGVVQSLYCWSWIIMTRGDVRGKT